MMMGTREKPKILEQTDKYCPFLDKSCIHEDCELYNSILENCSLNVLTYNVFKLNQAIEKVGKKTTNRMF